MVQVINTRAIWVSLPILTADRIFGGSHKKLLKKPHASTSFLVHSDGFRSGEDTHRVKSAWPRALPCRVNSMVSRPMKLYHSRSGATAALPTTAGSRDSRHGICRSAQNFGQGEPPFELERSVYGESFAMRHTASSLPRKSGAKPVQTATNSLKSLSYGDSLRFRDFMRAPYLA
jgi:hypothetical protein